MEQARVEGAGKPIKYLTLSQSFPRHQAGSLNAAKKPLRPICVCNCQWQQQQLAAF